MKLHTSLLCLLLATTALLSGCGFGFSDGKLTMDFSPLQIQNSVGPKFPQETCPTPITCLKFNNPKISLPEGGDRIQINLDATVTLLQQAISGTTIVSAKPRYQPTTGEVFLDDTQIKDIQLPGMSANVTRVIVQYGSLLAQQALQTTPIYSFKGASAERIAKMGIADVKVVDGKLRVIFDPMLAQSAK
ncbi:MAG: DUF1439 domain-containing protein [Burkholderiaceae bacterium]